MPHYVGSEVYLQFAGVAVNMDRRSFSWDHQIEDTESTAGTDTDKEFLLTVAEASGSIEFVESKGTAGTALRRLFYTGASGTLTWGDPGTASGDPKYSCVVNIMNVQRGRGYKDEAVKTISWKKSGEWIDNYDLDASDTW